MKKIAILIPAHCTPKVLKLTLGSWLETYNGVYQVKVFIGLHKNFSHYHTGQSEIEGLQDNPNIKVCFVDEIDWTKGLKDKDAWGYLMRYSTMHAVNLQNLMTNASGYDPDYVAVFDHDLVFKQDFVRWAFETYPLSDLIGCLMNDRDADREIYTHMGGIRFMPKFSIWHLVMTRKMFQKTLQELQTLYPMQSGHYGYDTFAKTYELAKNQWDMRVRAVREAELIPVVRHVWNMSMNMGVAANSENYSKKISTIEQEYDTRFPNGITHLLSKLKV